MQPKRLLIIGAGVAGLAAGCYGQMNGYQTEIFELHDLPGGLCTAWERRGYVFDGCIHYLFGSGEGQPFHRMWQELGAVQGRQFVHHAEYQRLTDGEQTLIVYSDPDRLEAHLCALSPEDAPLIHSLAEGIRHFTRFDMSLMQGQPKALMGPLEWGQLGLKMLPLPGRGAQVGGIVFQGLWAALQASLLAACCAADVFLGRGAGDDGHGAAGVHAHRQRRLPGGRFVGIRPRPRAPLPGTGRGDPLQKPGGEDPDRARPGGCAAPV